MEKGAMGDYVEEDVTQGRWNLHLGGTEILPLGAKGIFVSMNVCVIIACTDVKHSASSRTSS